MYNHCYANVALVDEMQELIVNTHQLANVVTIANPINIEEINKKITRRKITMPFNYCIAIGQFETRLSSFINLLLVMQIRFCQKKHLLILGGDRDTLEKVAKSKVLSFVHFQVIKKILFKYLKKF
jgi:N-acetylgalactosamine-N,N'-diacetylbacillosaminyl-diphospho-undecaprenol 4-alpha-N-acetylgalactosaminyltransferase